MREEREALAELGQQRILRAVYSERQLNEVLVDFWFNHFNIFAGKGADRIYLMEYERDVIRPHVLGKFRDLLGAVAESPAMLFYLDNWMSADPKMAEKAAAARGRFGIRAAAGVLPAASKDGNRGPHAVPRASTKTTRANCSSCTLSGWMAAIRNRTSWRWRARSRDGRSRPPARWELPLRAAHA